jgi:anti-sigma regulatory factor (Ser/Thr protein kinase)
MAQRAKTGSSASTARRILFCEGEGTQRASRGLAQASGAAASRGRGAVRSRGAYAGPTETPGLAMAATESLHGPSRSSIEIPGGDGAPERARRHLLSQLDGWASTREASDAALIVSELVTNSVVHAHVDHCQSLFLDLTTLGDHLRIAVTDHGSHLEPRIHTDDPLSSGGFGLRLVQELSTAWGVTRQTEGETRVWCELRLDPN